MTRCKWRKVSHRLILEDFIKPRDRLVLMCVLDEYIVCHSEKSQLLKGLQNQCKLFIHGSNPEICYHLICGYDR